MMMDPAMMGGAMPPGMDPAMMGVDPATGMPIGAPPPTEEGAEGGGKPEGGSEGINVTEDKLKSLITRAVDDAMAKYFDEQTKSKEKADGEKKERPEDDPIGLRDEVRGLVDALNGMMSGSGGGEMPPPPMDPAMMGGMPPMDPAAMMMDPAMMGGGGMPPMDPAAMMGPPGGGMPPGGMM